MIGCLVGNLTRNDSLSITNCFGNEMKWWKKRDDWKMRKKIEVGSCWIIMIDIKYEILNED